MPRIDNYFVNTLLYSVFFGFMLWSLLLLFEKTVIYDSFAVYADESEIPEITDYFTIIFGFEEN